MGKFFSRFKTQAPDPAVSSWGNLANFYSLLIFLIAIPFVLIIALVWVTGILGFNAYIFAGFAGLLAYIVWRLYRRWGIIKAKMAAQTGDFQDLMREAIQRQSAAEAGQLDTRRLEVSTLSEALLLDHLLERVGHEVLVVDGQIGGGVGVRRPARRLDAVVH